MENSSQSERKKSVLGAITANKLAEMLKNIDISSIKETNGGYNARARILALFDMGTFAETGAYIVRRGSSDDPAEAFESVITGYGAVGGRLVYAFVQDISRMKGVRQHCRRKDKHSYRPCREERRSRCRNIRLLRCVGL